MNSESLGNAAADSLFERLAGCGEEPFHETKPAWMGSEGKSTKAHVSFPAVPPALSWAARRPEPCICGLLSIGAGCLVLSTRRK